MSSSSQSNTKPTPQDQRQLERDLRGGEADEEGEAQSKRRRFCASGCISCNAAGKEFPEGMAAQSPETIT